MVYMGIETKDKNSKTNTIATIRNIKIIFNLFLFPTKYSIELSILKNIIFSCKICFFKFSKLLKLGLLLN